MSDMDIKRYDGKCVRIIDTSGDVFDGICCYNDEEYNDHEYGRCEEGLKIENFLFFKSDIREIQSLEEHRKRERGRPPAGRCSVLLQDRARTQRVRMVPC